MTITEIFKILAQECRNGCGDERSAYMYFERHYADKVDLQLVKTLVRIVNFAALRENDISVFNKIDM